MISIPLLHVPHPSAPNEYFDIIFELPAFFWYHVYDHGATNNIFSVLFSEEELAFFLILAGLSDAQFSLIFVPTKLRAGCSL